MRVKLKILLLLTIPGVLYFIFMDSLPPRTPYKIARNISDLPISCRMTLVRFDDGFTQNDSVRYKGKLFIELKLSDIELNNLLAEAKNKGYTSFPISDKYISEEMFSHSNQGYYLLKRNSIDPLIYELVLIDVENNALIVVVSDS